MGSFFSSLFSWFNSSESSFVIIGQDNAGKTTLYGLLTTNELKAASPTVHPNSGNAIIRSDKVKLIDLGGSDIQRRSWKTYLEDQDKCGVVYIVDCADTMRYEQTRRIFIETMKFISQDTPVAVLVNKIDLPTAMNYQAVIEQLSGDIRGFINSYNVMFFPCSLVQGQGYMNGMEWLLQKLKDM